MKKVLVFAGTTEGRKLCEELAAGGAEVTACVATEYGRVAMPPRQGLEVRAGRLDARQMEKLLRGFSLAVDATHPYADEVTRNIKKACDAAGAEYLRLIRPSLDGCGATVVPDAAAAAGYLSGTLGNVFLTTGTKELAAFGGLKERLFARVLPSTEAISACRAAGLEGRHVICMQGPFSHRLNLALLLETGAKYLVTKDSGAAGGFAEKLSAAKEAGAEVVLIARPGKESGLGLGVMTKLLYKKLGLGKSKDGYFPIFIDIKDKKIIVIGGGKVAARRAEVLLRFGARVEVVSPKLCDGLSRLCAEGRVGWREKGYEYGDLYGAALAVIATDSREANLAAAAEAAKRHIPASVADDRQKSSFYFPAVVEGGGVVGGLISEGGNDHAGAAKAAAEIRRMLNGGTL